MVEPLRHRQTKEAATDMFCLKPPRHISTLHFASFAATHHFGRYWVHSGHWPELALNGSLANDPNQSGLRAPLEGSMAARLETQLIAIGVNSERDRV